LNTLAEYGWRQASLPMVTRKSWLSMWRGAIEWFIHSYCGW